MPIFEYKCKNCGEKFDVLHKSLNNMSEVVCRKCGSEDAQKLVSGFASSVNSSSVGSASCSDGSCGVPQASYCPNGMCGLN